MKPTIFPMFGDFISLIDMGKIQPTVPTRSENAEIPNCLKYPKMGGRQKSDKHKQSNKQCDNTFIFKKIFCQ